MEEELVFLLLLGIIIFFIWNSDKKPAAGASAQKSAGQQGVASSPSYDGTAVPLDVIQAVVEKFQSSQEDMVPIETLFFTPVGEGKYNARLMFLNTRHFFGQQFDINASIDDSGAVTITNSETTSDPISYMNAYTPDSYQEFSTIQSAIDGQLQAALTASKSNTFSVQLASSFNNSFESGLSPSDLMTRASTGSEKMNP
jgi:hypothetical protein